MRFNIFRREQPVPIQSSDSAQGESIGGRNFAGEIERADGSRVSPSVSAWYRGVEVRANASSQLRPEVQRLDREGGKFCPYNYGKIKHLNYLMQVRTNN